MPICNVHGVFFKLILQLTNEKFKKNAKYLNVSESALNCPCLNLQTFMRDRFH